MSTAPVFEASDLRVSYPVHHRLARSGVTLAERREHRSLARLELRRRKEAAQAAALGAAAKVEYAGPKRTTSDGWNDTAALIRRLRRTTFGRRQFRARSLLRPASAFASFALVVSAVTPSLAHWVAETSANVTINTGQIVAVVVDLKKGQPVSIPMDFVATVNRYEGHENDASQVFA